MYLSVFFLLYPDINFGRNNFFSSKPLSIWFSLIYVCLHLGKIKKIRVEEFCFGISLLGSIIMGLVFSSGENGISRISNGYIGFGAVYFAIRIFTTTASRKKIYKLITTMFKSYLFIILFFGGLQFAYIYLGHLEIIGQFLKSVLYRGSDYFYNLGISGKIDFTFTEPSLAGLYFYCYFLPVCWLCKKYRLVEEKKLRTSLLIAFILNMFTISTRWYLDSIVCAFIIWLTSSKHSRVHKKAIVKGLMLSTILLLILAIVIKFVIPKEIINGQIIRFTTLFTKSKISSVDSDQSFMVRLILLYVGIAAFFNNPLFGVGEGNFYLAMKKYMITPSGWRARAELTKIASDVSCSSYSFYTTSLGCGGLFGVIMIGSVIKTLFSSNAKEFKTLGLIIIYMFLQLELFGTPLIAIWLAVINSGCFIAFENKKERTSYENFNYYAV